MFAAIQKASGAAVALTNGTYNHAKKLGSIKAFLGSLGGGSSKGDGGRGSDTEWPEVSWFVVDATLRASASSSASSGGGGLVTNGTDTSSGSSSPAFLQFTSGSTSEPKGVVITHGNLAHNLDLIVTGLSASDDTVSQSVNPSINQPISQSIE
jgi:acyl-CoA synthetase (AMP-forming)/AMP-acid ligase II